MEENKKNMNVNEESLEDIAGGKHKKAERVAEQVRDDISRNCVLYQEKGMTKEEALEDYYYNFFERCEVGQYYSRPSYAKLSELFDRYW